MFGSSKWHHVGYDNVKTKNYLILCAAITVVVVLGLLYVPGVSDTVEQVMLVFLSITAS